MSKDSDTGLDYWPKFQHIVPAYFAIGVLTVAGLIAFRWAFTEYLPGVEIKEDLWEYWIPFAFPVVPVVIWLRPRLRILKFYEKTEDRRFLFLTLAFFSIVLPSVIAQHVVLRAMANLQHVPSISAINPDRPNRYYSVSEFEVQAALWGTHANVHASGKHNEYLNFDLYFVFPISGPGDNVSADHNYWYGIKRHNQISNRLSDQEKEEVYRSTYEHAIGYVNSYDFHDQEYFEVVPASADRDYYRLAAKWRTGRSWEKGLVFLVPGEGAFADRPGSKLDWIFISSGIGFAVFLLFLTWPNYDQRELRRQRRGEKPEGEFVDGFREFFIPRNDYFVAPILLDAIIIIYLVQVFSGIHPIHPTGGDLLEWGANRRSETTGGEWWRLVSSMFLHGGLAHLIMNVFGLLLAALFVEPVYGRVRFLVIYVLAGIGGSLASIWWYENTISVGASGAIFGLFGAIFAFAAMGVIRFGSLIWLSIYLGLSLLAGLSGGIDNAAHLGGLITGFLVGLLLQLSAKFRREPSPR